MFNLIDVSEFKITSIPTLGYTEKLWLKDKNNVRWLLKYASQKYPSDAVNEKLCCEIAKIFNIPFQQVELCIDNDGKLGCICKNFLTAGETLVHGGSLLGKFLDLSTSSPKFGRNTDKQYTLQLILNVLNDLEEEFIWTVLLDNLVGNIDRHDKNWALIMDQTGKFKLSPCYDYGLSFYQTKETDDTWFQDIGFEVKGVITFNNLFFNICLEYKNIVSEFLQILDTDIIIKQFQDIFSRIPIEFQLTTKHQLDFLLLRREKMLKIWRKLNGRGIVSENNFKQSNLFNRKIDK